MSSKQTLIESDSFGFEFLSRLAERESWRKEVHRPVYHVHKWWAKRLGSVFRGIVLGALLPEHSRLDEEFYKPHDFQGTTVFDPFMGSGTTIGESHKLGCTALGRDINPVAVRAARTAFGRLDKKSLFDAFLRLSDGTGGQIRRLYRSVDSLNRPCDVLYYFWVMQADCPACNNQVDIFTSYIIARHAHPKQHPEVQLLCPGCGNILPGKQGDRNNQCPRCQLVFDATLGPAKNAKATCNQCLDTFSIRDSIASKGTPPSFRLYAKLVLTSDGCKEYLPTDQEDQAAYSYCSEQLRNAVARKELQLPVLELRDGYNTRQAMNYGFRRWKDFFNDRQLLGLGLLRQGIQQLEDHSAREALTMLFSGVLEFNNLFASYKGEGTGAVRHMFSHHILKPERTPIEANIWGTPRSSGSFSNLFKSRLVRAAEYCEQPHEVHGASGPGLVCSPAFRGEVEPEWPAETDFSKRAIYVSCGDSAVTELPDASVDIIVTDPPFFDNVHYSELADFFFAWQQLDNSSATNSPASTRNAREVQHGDANEFAGRLEGVFRECHRILKDRGLLVFTYHHSRSEGWGAVASSLLRAKFRVMNAHPVKAEMSVATPKSQSKSPIQLDIIIVCRKDDGGRTSLPTTSEAMASAFEKMQRLCAESFQLSENDRRIVLYGQLLTTLRNEEQIAEMARIVETELQRMPVLEPRRSAKVVQTLLFGEG